MEFAALLNRGSVWSGIRRPSGRCWVQTGCDHQNHRKRLDVASQLRVTRPPDV
jgi:hypothetical protein